MARPKKQPTLTWMTVTEFIANEKNLQTLLFIQYTLKTRIETLQNGASHRRGSCRAHGSQCPYAQPMALPKTAFPVC